MIKRTKRLTESRALKILQLRYGTQVQKVKKITDKNTYGYGLYFIDSIVNHSEYMTREDILAIENNIYQQFGV